VKLNFVPPPPRPDPPAHCLRATCHGIIGANNRFANIFWVRNGQQSVPSSADLSWIAGSIYGLYSNSLFLPHTCGCTLEACNVIYYGPDGLQLGGDYVANTVSAIQAGTMPASSSMCISWKVQQRYKGGHPRTYLPPFDVTAMLDAAHWDDGVRDGVRQEADQFHAALNGSGQGGLTDLHLGTVSFVLDNAWRSPPVFRDFTPAAAEVDKRIDTQRRRLGPDI